MNIKTPVSWMGNKTSILHILYALFPLNYERYIEPFGGSGAVLLGKKKPDKFEVYNDYNHNLVNLFRCMRDRPMAFIKELGFYPLNSKKTETPTQKPVQKHTEKPTQKPTKKPTQPPTKAKTVDVQYAVSACIAYGQQLGMKYDSSLNTGNASWFSPTNASYYDDTQSLKADCYGDVEYVAYYYQSSGITSSDLSFNVIAENNKIYVVYC